MKIKQHKKLTTKKQSNKQQKYTDFVTFIILCDIPGYRMKSYGPSCLLQIGKTKLIDHQLSIINDTFENFEILLCLGFESDIAIKYIYQNKNKQYYNIRMIENQLFEQYYSCESLRLALNATNSKQVFIVDGSLLINKDTFKNIILQENVIFSQKDQDNFEISFNINENKEVEHMSFGASTVWIDMLYINNDGIDQLKDLLSTGNYKNKFIFEAINELIKLKIQFKPHKIKNNIRKINNIKSYNEVRNKR
jgi:hypothetical protein